MALPETDIIALDSSQTYLMNEISSVKTEINNFKGSIDNVKTQVGKGLEMLKSIEGNSLTLKNTGKLRSLAMGGTKTSTRKVDDTEFHDAENDRASRRFSELLDKSASARATAHPSGHSSRKSRFSAGHCVLSRAMSKENEVTMLLKKMFGNKSDHRWFRWLRSFILWASTLEEPERYGCLASVVNNIAFEPWCMLAIAASTGFTIYGANWQFNHLTERPTATMVLVERVFLCWFTVELLLKLVVHRLFFFVGPDVAWNCFDLGLVSSSLFDTITTIVQGDSGGSSIAFLRIVRIFKVAKVLRAVRLLRFIRELRVIFECLIGSIRSLFWCFALTVFISGFFAILFVNNMATWIIESNEGIDGTSAQAIMDRFGSVQRTLLLLTQVSYEGLDWGVVYSDLMPTGFLNCAAFLLYLLVFRVAFLNIITSLFVEKAMLLAEPDTKELMHEKQMQDLANAKELFEVVQEHLDTQQTGMVSQEGFRMAMRNPAVRAAFEVRDVPIKDAETFFNTLTTQGEDSVRIELFVAGCIRMRGYVMSSDLQTLIVDAEQKSAHLEVLARQGRQRSAFIRSLQQQVTSLRTI